jgi:excisionase family DNA binding protein
MMTRMLRVHEVACRLACSTRTVRRWIADGTLKSVKLHGLRLIPESVFEQLVGNSDPDWLDESVPVVVSVESISAPTVNPSSFRPPKTNPQTETMRQADLFETAPVSQASSVNAQSK